MKRLLFNVHMIVFGSEHVREHRTLLGERYEQLTPDTL